MVVGLGAAGALLLGLSLAFVFRSEEPGPRQAPPAAKGGLQVSVDNPRPADLAKPLRCFVEGRYVGMATIAVCAARNGVASNELDVAVDDSGELAAAPTASLAPPPAAPVAGQPIQPSSEIVPTVVDAGPTGVCLRYVGAEWRQVGDAPLTLNGCVRALYDGRCERPGGAQYGRWEQTTLRLVPGRVERSGDDRTFTTLVQQTQGCGVPALR